jgi:hypothetical protein
MKKKDFTMNGDTDFDKAIKHGPPQSLKEYFYEKYFLPYLTNNPDPASFIG